MRLAATAPIMMQWFSLPHIIIMIIIMIIRLLMNRICSADNLTFNYAQVYEIAEQKKKDELQRFERSRREKRQS